MKIVTDSAADLTAEDRQDLPITVAPLLINFPEGEVRSDDLTPDQFYNRLEAMAPQVPTTSQPSGGDFAKIYQELGPEAGQILSIHISSGLSGTIGAAELGAQKTPDVNVQHFDTLTLSGGERFHVLAAAHMAQAGERLETILERLRAIRAATEVIYTLETLDYLARGGRIGRVQALAGSLLKIKPIIYVDKKDGKYDQLGRERTIKRSLEKIAANLADKFGDQPLWVSVMHGRFAEQAEQLSALLSKQLKIGKLEVLRISPVLGVHTGPGIVGAAVTPLALMEPALK